METLDWLVEHWDDWLVAAHSRRAGSLLEILHSSRRNSSDPRDRIIAFIAASDVAGLPTFRPDYSLSVEECYIGYSRSIIRHYESLKGLAYADSQRRHYQHLPSWVRDWSCGASTITAITDEGLHFVQSNCTIYHRLRAM
jgi:hypothetical protein